MDLRVNRKKPSRRSSSKQRPLQPGTGLVAVLLWRECAAPQSPRSDVEPNSTSPLAMHRPHVPIEVVSIFAHTCRITKSLSGVPAPKSRAGRSLSRNLSARLHVGRAGAWFSANLEQALFQQHCSHSIKRGQSDGFCDYGFDTVETYSNVGMGNKPRGTWAS